MEETDTNEGVYGVNKDNEKEALRFMLAGVVLALLISLIFVFNIGLQVNVDFAALTPTTEEIMACQMPKCHISWERAELMRMETEVINYAIENGLYHRPLLTQACIGGYGDSEYDDRAECIINLRAGK